jgi:hypothetical protein
MTLDERADGQEPAVIQGQRRVLLRQRLTVESELKQLESLRCGCVQLGGGLKMPGPGAGQVEERAPYSAMSDRSGEPVPAERS